MIISRTVVLVQNERLSDAHATRNSDSWLRNGA